MKFPLPQGHKFGLNPFDISVHDCSTSFAESEQLRAFQIHCMLSWNPNLVPSGRWDGPTQQMTVEIQRVSGLPISGLLNQDTWVAAFSRPERDEKAPETAPESTETDEQTPDVVDTTPEAVVSAEAPKPNPTRRGPGRPRK